jgi:hypothetical protein
MYPGLTVHNLRGSLGEKPHCTEILEKSKSLGTSEGADPEEAEVSHCDHHRHFLLLRMVLFSP